MFNLKIHKCLIDPQLHQTISPQPQKVDIAIKIIIMHIWLQQQIRKIICFKHRLRSHFPAEFSVWQLEKIGNASNKLQIGAWMGCSYEAHMSNGFDCTEFDILLWIAFRRLTAAAKEALAGELTL